MVVVVLTSVLAAMLTAVLTVLTVLAWVLAGLAALLLILLCIPWRIAGRIDGIDIHELTPGEYGDLSWNAKASWLFGLICFLTRGKPGHKPVLQLQLFGFRRTLAQGAARRTSRRRTVGGTGKAGRRSSADAQRKSGSRYRGRIKLPPVQTIQNVLPELPRFIGRLWRTMALQIKGNIVYGLLDPAMTGLSQGVLAVLPVPVELRLTPDYEHARFSGRAEGDVTLYPIKIVAVVVQTALRPVIRTLWWSRVRQKLGLHQRMPAKSA